MRTPKKILERRTSVRIEEVLPFQIDHNGYEIEAKTVNISAHGAMCLVDKEIPTMTQLDIVLTLPPTQKPKQAAKKIRAKGIVVRKESDPDSDGFLIAIYFSDMKEPSRLILEKFIENRLAK